MDENEFLLLDRIQKIQSINEMYDLENNAYLSFSGGKDSTVLHYLLDKALPGNRIPRLFLNTGIEYKFILDFVKEMSSKDDRIIIYNVGKNITETLSKVGYPFKSKEHSQKVMEYRMGNRNNSMLRYFKIIPNGYRPCPDKLLYQMADNGLKISNKCCHEFKKMPASKWMNENNKSVVITGMRKEEGGTRVQLNCIVTDKENRLKKFHPLSVANENFENWFIERERV